MPNFPAFAQRLAEINNPIKRKSADTPMEVGGYSPTLITGGNPLRRRRPAGIDGQIPLVQNQASSDGLPLSSGTGAEPRGDANPLTSKIKQAVAADARYEDIAPKMEEIPATPAFDPKPVKGIGGRIKAAFQAAGAALQMHPDNPYAGLVGLAAGTIKPDIAQGLDYKTRVLPAAQREQAAVMQRNDARQKSFGIELQNRERLAKINQMGEPDWASVPGGESPMLYDKRSGSTRPVLGQDGKPLRNATVVNTETKTDSAEEIARQKRMSAAELEAAESRHKFEILKLKYDNENREREKDRQHKAELEKLREGGRNRRAGQSEAGKNSRNAANLNERKRATNLRYGDDGDAPITDKPKKQAAPPPQ